MNPTEDTPTILGSSQDTPTPTAQGHEADNSLLAARRSENHYWIDYYSWQIKALDGFEDKPEKDRLKALRKQHQDRVNDLITEGLSQDTVTASRPGEHKKQELEGKI